MDSKANYVNLKDEPNTSNKESIYSQKMSDKVKSISFFKFF